MKFVGACLQISRARRSSSTDPSLCTSSNQASRRIVKPASSKACSKQSQCTSREKAFVQTKHAENGRGQKHRRMHAPSLSTRDTLLAVLRCQQGYGPLTSWRSSWASSDGPVWVCITSTQLFASIQHSSGVKLDGMPLCMLPRLLRSLGE